MVEDFHFSKRFCLKFAVAVGTAIFAVVVPQMEIPDGVEVTMLISTRSATPPHF